MENETKENILDTLKTISVVLFSIFLIKVIYENSNLKNAENSCDISQAYYGKSGNEYRFKKCKNKPIQKLVRRK